MRATIAKNINSLIPDSSLPEYVIKSGKINLRRFKKMIWKKLNCIERARVSKRIRQES
jgi:hypothetical protein